MSDELLKAVTKAKVHLGEWLRTTTANVLNGDGGGDGDGVRGRDRDRGQTAVEYLGIIVVVVAIVVAISGTSIGSSIKGAITNKIAELMD